ncbi:unnamed protein product [Danaus chrysippus]|uniref:(African queen) hypothetical protein n=1 Tax=Danaus chrysippus TaxID=151541 RepID=A0A8J2QHI2_9NEOP|nr:unnamed protein product [Danaus chrysippus]
MLAEPKISGKLWHRRLAHINSEDMNKKRPKTQKGCDSDTSVYEDGNEILTETLTTDNLAQEENAELLKALAGPESEQCKRAMSDELQSFEDNDAWELVDNPGDVTIMKCRWVLNKKFDVDNNN